MKYSLLLFFLLPLFSAFAQDDHVLTPEEKAYFFHIVHKSPILDTNIGRYFEYRGPLIRYGNKELNYDSIEAIIINKPEILLIRTSEIAKSPKGIVAEATNKVALWELNKTLNAKRKGGEEFQNFITQYMRFEEILIPLLPPNAFKVEDGKEVPHPKLDQLLNPTLSFNDKKELISTYHFLDLEDQLLTLNALNAAVNKYVEEKSLYFYRLLGAEANMYANALVAAGDGSTTSGLLEEREKDEKGKWNRGLPKAVGLFPYQIELKKDEKAKKPALSPLRFATLDFQTAGGNRMTNIHCDVWGYNATKQTTVVIEKNGLSYHLFGSEETRFLTPDSNFTKGATFQGVINDLEHKHIAKLDELIHGKKGFDYQIEYHTKKRDETEMKIEKSEKEYSDMGYSPISTKSKASRKVKKARKKNRKKGGGPLDVQPTTDSGKKPRGKKQQTIIDLYNEYEFHKRRIEEIKIERQLAMDQRAIYQRRLDYYKQLMGYKWANFTEKDGLYTFEDSATFDINTQEFTFPAEKDTIPFEVRLLSIPANGLSDIADEVMLHVNVVDAKPSFDARIQIHLEDVFESDKYQLSGSLLKNEDSLAVRQFFEALMLKKNPFNIVVRGQGMGYWNGARVVQNTDTLRTEISAYPGNSAQEKQRSRMDSSFLRLRKSEVLISLNRGVLMEVNSFTDPVASALKVSNEDILEKMEDYKLTKNQILSAYRSYTILMKLKEELNVLAGTYLKKDEAKLVIDKLNTEISKVKIVVGQTSIDLDEFKN